jgi:predicted RNA-binding protein Jag
MARYNAVNARAEEVAAQPFKKFGTTAEDFVAQINEQQKKGIAGINAAADVYQPYIDSATAATVAGMDEANAAELDINKYMSPYIQNVADTTGAMLSQENARAQSGNLGTAISSGAFGGDRAGIAAANLSQQQNLAYGKTMADIYNEGYNNSVGVAQQQQGVNLAADQANLARLTAGGAQLADLGVTAQDAGIKGAEAQINAGTLEQQTEQAGKTALINQFMQEQGFPFQVAQFLANIATGTGAVSGSTTATTQPAPFFSDRRLKHDVKRIGKTDDGLPIYSFKYKGD